MAVTISPVHNLRFAIRSCILAQREIALAVARGAMGIREARKALDVVQNTQQETQSALLSYSKG